MSRSQLAEKLGVGGDDMDSLERGELGADWGTMRLARELGGPLRVLFELAEESAPGKGGEDWRRWSLEADRERGVG